MLLHLVKLGVQEVVLSLEDVELGGLILNLVFKLIDLSGELGGQVVDGLVEVGNLSVQLSVDGLKVSDVLVGLSEGGFKTGNSGVQISDLSSELTVLIFKSLNFSGQGSDLSGELVVLVKSLIESL